MTAMASAITSRTIIYSAVYSGADQRKHQSSASLAFVRGIYRWPVNSPHKWPVTRKIVPFDDVIMVYLVIVTPKLIYSQEIMYKTCFYSSMATLQNSLGGTFRCWLVDPLRAKTLHGGNTPFDVCIVARYDVVSRGQFDSPRVVGLWRTIHPTPSPPPDRPAPGHQHTRRCFR